GEELTGVEKIVLPGVGAFGAAMEKLKESGFYESVREWLLSNKPFLGICLGMQLLFEESLESEGIKGLGLFRGKCLRFQKGKVPQIGWNQIKIERHSRLLEGIEDGSFFYFLHGYYVAPKNGDIVVATTDYGITYPSILEKGHIFAVQFHPEKSGEKGLRLLQNWVKLC
ncbi:MAG: imidazole glycerol phosphate synthase subunit HisH, partial [candidate division KSB1 bacterium]|nr:imidazole glycerol phosphate synthase subunit HisH [candidate division KSB1 bacterium]